MIVQRLTDYIWVGLDSVLNESHITNVARIFYALKANLGKLEFYYEKVQPSDDLPADSRYFPSITAYFHSGRFVDFVKTLNPERGKIRSMERSYTGARQNRTQGHKECYNVGSGLGFNLCVAPSS